MPRPRNEFHGKLNRYEMLYLIRQKDEEAYKLLFNDLQPLAERVYRGYLEGVMPRYEWTSHSYETFEKMLDRYQEKSKTDIGAFYFLMLHKRAVSIIRQVTASGSSLRQSVSLDGLEEDGILSTRLMTISEAAGYAGRFESDILAKVSAERVLDLLYDVLSSEDWTILAYLACGYPRYIICRIMRINRYRIRSAVDRAKSAWVFCEGMLKADGCAVGYKTAQKRMDKLYLSSIKPPALVLAEKYASYGAQTASDGDLAKNGPSCA